MTTLDKFKVQAILWLSDEQPEKYVQWDEQMGSLCRATQGGAPLEDYYCIKVGKTIQQRVAVPSYLLNDPVFIGATAINLGAAAESSGSFHGDATSMAQSTNSGTCINSLQPAAITYMELPLESRNLDALLYNVLLMHVKSSKNALLQCVTFPSYVQAKIVLNKHMDISRSDRKSRAFAHMDTLTYKGDPHAFEVHAVSAWRELIESNCSIKDYAMTRVMKAFDGKSKTTQHKIAQHLNNNDLESLSFFDLIHSYCSDLASVGDTQAPHCYDAIG